MQNINIKGTVVVISSYPHFKEEYHSGPTRVRSIRFHLFKSNVFWSIIFKLTELFFLYFSFKMYMLTNKYLRKKAIILCKVVQILIESHRFMIYWQNHQIQVIYALEYFATYAEPIFSFKCNKCISGNFLFLAIVTRVSSIAWNRDSSIDVTPSVLIWTQS